MASSSRKRQTIAKRNRERAVKEKRALKLEKKAARKQAAADARNGTVADVMGTLEVPTDPAALVPDHEPEHDGTGVLSPQRDDEQRHVAGDGAVDRPDRIAG
jgi:hypothetical protein